MGIKDSMAKNIEIIKVQFHNWLREMKYVTWEVKDLYEEGDYKGIPYKLHSYVEETFNHNPRIISYLFYPVAAWHIWIFVN